MDLTADWQYLQEIATKRLERNKTERHVSDYGTDIELMGAAGELAARRFLQLNEELHFQFDGGADMVFKDIRIDVKATKWFGIEHRFMQWPPWREIRAHVILLTAINLDRRSAILIGYARPHEIHRASINEHRAYPCHEIAVDKLNKASKLLFMNGPDDLYPSTQARAYPGQYSHRAGATP